MSGGRPRGASARDTPLVKILHDGFDNFFTYRPTKLTTEGDQTSRSARDARRISKVMRRPAICDMQ